MQESVLFWPVFLKDETLWILDETLIPKSVTYIKVKDYTGAIEAVVEMKTRAFGQFLTVCYAFMLEVKKAPGLDREQTLELLKQIAEAFNKSRPTFPFEEVTGMVLGIAQKVINSPHFREDFLKAMEGMLGGIRQQRLNRAEEAASLIKDGYAILTHCHVSGEMAMVGEICRRDKKNVRFYATETRPYFQGSRLTAWELSHQRLDVTLVPDNAVAKLMSDGKIDCVLVGSDRSAKNGDFANKIGTYQIAILAKHFSVPFYVLVQPSQRLESGRDIPIEIRNDSEILSFNGRWLGDKRLKAYYPGFDVVPHELVTKHIAIHGR
jgi:methylthioribose-1-phosphate isomerase